MRALILASIVIAIAFPVTLSAQVEPYQEVASLHQGSRLYYEAVALPGGPEGNLLVVEFRIPNDRLVFMRHMEGLSDELFRSTVSVTVELFQEGRIVSEKMWRSESFETDYEATLDPKRSIAGSVSFSIPKGEYGVRLRLNDLNTERTANTQIRPVTVPALDSIAVGRAMLADTVVGTDMVRYVSLVNLGGDAHFGREFVAVVPVSLDPTQKPDDAELNWRLRRLDFNAVREEMKSRRRQIQSYRRKDQEEDEMPRMEPPPIMEGGTPIDSGRVGFASFMPIRPIKAVDVHRNRITLTDPGDSSHVYLAVIDLHGRHLENGTYVLDAKLGGSAGTAQSTTRFNMHWPDMPLSLFDIDVAIKNLRFIADKGVIDRLKSGSREDKINKFKNFWAGKDPTPETAYNELMVEYYRRVDYAALEFRTGPGMNRNGLETDRARIYIVNGPPDEISRSFPEEGGVLETWTYSDGKTFTFEAASSIDPFHIVKEG